MPEPSANAAPENGPAPDFLLGNAASLVTALVSRSDTEWENVAGLVQEVHSCLLGIYSGLVAPSAEPAVPAVADLSEYPDIERALSDMGASFASVTLAPVEPRPVPAPSSSPKPAPRPAAEALPPAASAKLSETPPQEAPAPEVPASVEGKPAARGTAKAKAQVKAKAKKRAVAKMARPAKPVPELKLPRGVRSVEETVRMQSIVCLEDGRRVKDLRAHLAERGMSPQDYRRKWGLPDEYPMMAPAAIRKRGQLFEVDLVTGRLNPKG